MYIFKKSNSGKTYKNESILNLDYDKCGNVVQLRQLLHESAAEKKLWALAYDGFFKIHKSTVSHSSGNQTINRFYDEKGAVLLYESPNRGTMHMLTDSAGNIISQFSQYENKSYMYIHGQKIGFIETNSERPATYLYLDQPGSVISRSTQHKGTKQYLHYTPFGFSSTSQLMPDLYRNQTMGFQNMLTDEDGLMVTRNGRAYVPWLQRFLQRDPLSPFSKVGVQAYAFAANNPVLYSDPSGYSPVKIPQLQPSAIWYAAIPMEDLLGMAEETAEASETAAAAETASGAAASEVEATSTAAAATTSAAAGAEEEPLLDTTEGWHHSTDAAVRSAYKRAGHFQKPSQVRKWKDIARCRGACTHYAVAKTIGHYQPELEIDVQEMVERYPSDRGICGGFCIGMDEDDARFTLEQFSEERYTFQLSKDSLTFDTHFDKLPLRDLWRGEGIGNYVEVQQPLGLGPIARRLWGDWGHSFAVFDEGRAEDIVLYDLLGKDLEHYFDIGRGGPPSWGSMTIYRIERM